MKPEDIFSQVFGGMSGFNFGGFDLGGGGRRRQQSTRTPNIEHNLEVPLEDLYTGTTRKLEFKKKVLCTTCNGRGTEKIGVDTTCSQCRGSGMEIKSRQFGPMIQQIQQACSVCHGEGVSIKAVDRCKACNGQRILNVPKQLEIKIEPGMQSGEQIIFQGEAHQEPGAVPGDISITVTEKPHPKYIRKGSDLYTTNTINLVEALGGFSFPMESLDKRKIRVASDPGGKIVPHGDVRMIKGEGMPRFKNPTQKGDLYVKLNVEIPKGTFLDDQVIKNVETHLGQKRHYDKTQVEKEVQLVEPSSGSKANFDFEPDKKQQQQQKVRRQRHEEEQPGQCAQM